MQRLMRGLWLVACAPLALAGCGELSPSGDDATGSVGQLLAHPGPWKIPDQTLAIGDIQYVAYTGGGPWVGEEGCSGSITPGAVIVRDYLYAHFPQTDSIGGYSCRHVNGDSSRMSVHGAGRALDLMIPLDGGEADNDLGDPPGNWLIENAEAIGIQYIIWDLYTWKAALPQGEKDRDYGGAHPHHDHLHVELSVAASERTDNWFEDLVEPPPIPGCAPLPRAGGLIEETDACLGAFGNPDYWRHEDAGHGGSLIWTNAFESDDPGNWARWNLTFEEAGSYLLEVYVDPVWGVHRKTRYRVKHGGGELVVVIDQGAADGWVSLGEFDFDVGAQQYVDVYDDMPEPVEDDQHIAVDALRITGTNIDDPAKPGDSNDPAFPGDPDDPAEPPAAGKKSGDDGGCSAARGPAGRPGLFAFALALLALARRRRR